MAATRNGISAPSVSAPPMEPVLQETTLALASAVVISLAVWMVIVALAVVPAVLIGLYSGALRAMRSAAPVPSSSFRWHRQPARAVVGGWPY
jgi:hypothetical protein